VTSTAAFHGEAAHRSAMLAAVGRAVGHEGVPVMGARLLDVEVDLLVVADEAEHTRRMAAEAEFLDDWDALRVLMSLPRWEPVPLRSLTPDERHAVRSAPHGAVEVTGESVTRLAGPPVTRVLAVVTDTDWDRGLNVASRFAPVATRVLVLSNPPAELSVVAAEAAEFGIGLAVSTAGAPRLAVLPERWRENYVSAGGWLFREQAYRAYLDQATRSESRPVTARG
jgi:hypothetical protein